MVCYKIYLVNGIFSTVGTMLCYKIYLVNRIYPMLGTMLCYKIYSREKNRTQLARIPKQEK